MTCYDCGRQLGDVCRREDGCTAQDAPVHSMQPQPQVNRAAAPKPKRAKVQDLRPAAAWPFPSDQERELLEQAAIERARRS